MFYTPFQPSNILWGKMEDDFRSLCEDSPGVMGYSLLDLKSRKRCSFNENVLLPTASTIKIPILLALARRVDEGRHFWGMRIPLRDQDKVAGSGILYNLKYDVELSLWDMASLMIALSDNTATNICIDIAGMDYINNMLLSLGLPNTKVKRLMMDVDAPKRGDENVSTPRELVKLLRRIEERDGIKDEVSKDVLELLELPKGGAFKEALPENIRYANKPGGLGNLSVDAGIIYYPEKTFVLAVMGAFLPENPGRFTVSLVKSAHEYMKILDRCTELGRS